MDHGNELIKLVQKLSKCIRNQPSSSAASFIINHQFNWHWNRADRFDFQIEHDPKSKETETK